MPSSPQLKQRILAAVDDLVAVALFGQEQLTMMGEVLLASVARHAPWTMQCRVDGTLSRRSAVTT